jgi:hypothetical protein
MTTQQQQLVMTTQQQQLYFRLWAAAAKAHGWNTQAGIADALQRRSGGERWVSPDLDQCLAAIYRLAGELAAQGGRSPNADDFRRACLCQATGYFASSRALTNAEFDRVIDLLRLLANPDDLANVARYLDPEAGDRRRYLHTIGRVKAEYSRAVARDKFGVADVESLNLQQLRQLALTLRLRLKSQPAIEMATPF